eukprot:gene8313-1588_t
MPPKTFSGMRNFKYGMPLYGIAFPEGNVFYLCGGGGMGIKNRLVFAESKFGLITDQIGEHLFGEDCPMKMVMTPNGKSIVFAMTKGGIVRLDLDLKQKVPKIVEMSGDLKERLGTVKGDVRCFAFSSSGDQLALGVGDGSLQVYEWPAMKIKMDLSGDKKLPDSVRDVDFGLWQDSSQTSSSDSLRPARVLSAVLDDGSCQLWEWDKAVQVCTIGMKKGMEAASITRLRFSREEGSFGFHTLSNAKGGAYLTHWTPETEVKGKKATKGSEKGSKAAVLPLPVMQASMRASQEAGTCLEASKDGSQLAVGTSEGSALVVRASDFRLKRKLVQAHMVFTTGVAFTPDQKHLVSISADASVQTMSLEGPFAKQGTIFHKIVCLTFIAFALFMTCFAQYIRVLKDGGHDVHAMRVRWLTQAASFLGHPEWISNETAWSGEAVEHEEWKEEL